MIFVFLVGARTPERDSKFVRMMSEFDESRREKKQGNLGDYFPKGYVMVTSAQEIGDFLALQEARDVSSMLRYARGGGA